MRWIWTLTFSTLTTSAFGGSVYLESLTGEVGDRVEVFRDEFELTFPAAVLFDKSLEPDPGFHLAEFRLLGGGTLDVQPLGTNYHYTQLRDISLAHRAVSRFFYRGQEITGFVARSDRVSGTVQMIAGLGFTLGESVQFSAAVPEVPGAVALWWLLLGLLRSPRSGEE